jgi:hypothetical protein
MPRMLKYLRIAVSALSLTVCVLLVALWARSYWWADALWYRPTKTIAFRVMSDEGGFTFLTAKGINLLILGDPPPMGLSHRDYWYEGYARATAGASILTKVFRGFHDRSRATWQIPHWLLVVLAASTAALPWTARRGWRFSLRTLLVATTLAAVALGIVVLSI